jgi:putative transcription factor
LVENYGKRIRKARESLGLNIEEFAKRIAEKESLMRKIENQQMKPDKKLVDKIEKFLKIKITETPEERKIGGKSKKQETLTIGDIARIK